MQQARSIYLSQILKADIWDVKNAFKNDVNRIIIQENFKTWSLKELEDNALRRIKSWILTQRPLTNMVEGPWQVYVKLLQDKDWQVDED